jgi:hypothetical protein
MKKLVKHIFFVSALCIEIYISGFASVPACDQLVENFARISHAIITHNIFATNLQTSPLKYYDEIFTLTYFFCMSGFCLPIPGGQ